MAARLQPLDHLLRGIAREIRRVEKTDIFLYRERRDYFDALRRLWAGIENARVVLVKVPQRLAR
jgi:hypothetical protein